MTNTNRKAALAIDFDGTLVECAFPGIGKDLGGLFWLSQLKMAGCELILWTSRHGDELDDAEDWLLEHGYVGIITGINMKAESSPFDTDPRKIGVDIYVDEKGFGAPIVRYPDRAPHFDWHKGGPMLLREVANLHARWKGSK